MALRPVSDLGLVDPTDLASPKAKKTTSRRPPARAKAQPQATRSNPNNRRSSTPARSASAGARSQPRRKPQKTRATTPPRKTTNGARAPKIGISVATGVVGVAAGLLLSRSAQRR